MPIVTPVPLYKARDLLYAVTNTPTGLFTQLGEAVKAKATLRDPLQFLLNDEGRSEADNSYTKALDWLRANAPLIDALQPDVLRRGWVLNVELLAEELIKINYLQGWSSNHPAFWLELTPIDKASQPRPIKKSFWALFVQAVMANHWLKNCEHFISGYRDMAIAQCTGFLAGAPFELGENYPLLGIRKGNAYQPLRTGHSVVLKWRRNIDTATSYYDNWLSRSGR